jgi:hypothetical protein
MTTVSSKGLKEDVVYRDVQLMFLKSYIAYT